MSDPTVKQIADRHGKHTAPVSAAAACVSESVMLALHAVSLQKMLVLLFTINNDQLCCHLILSRAVLHRLDVHSPQRRLCKPTSACAS